MSSVLSSEPADIVAAIRTVVNDRRDDFLAILQELLRASAEGESATQAVVKQRLDSLGWSTSEIRRAPSEITTRHEFSSAEETDERPRLTVIGESVTRRNHESGLLLWAHPDGMQFDGAAGWKHDPFAGVVEDGRVYGWGVADDLSGVATMVAVAEVMTELGSSDTNRLVVASTPSKNHASGVLAALDTVPGINGGIYLHPAESGNGLRDIKALAPGMLRFRLVVEGRPPDTHEPNHTLYAGDAVNPIDLMNDVLAAIRTVNLNRSARLPNRSAQMLVSLMSAGESVSRSPERCTATITFSMPPGESLDDTRDDIVAAVDTVSSAESWTSPGPARIEWLFGTTGVQTALNHPLYRTVQYAVTQITGTRPDYYGGHISSEIRQPILNHGIPCVGIGPRSGSLTQAGSASDEWLDLEDYYRLIAVCTLATATWGSRTGESGQS